MIRANDDAILNADTDDILRYVISTSKSPEKGLYIDELARRALVDTTLLSAAIEAIDLERAMTPRRGPALGWLGGARILSSDNRPAVAALLAKMRDWTADEQRDLLRVLSGRSNFSTLVQRLSEEFDWHPKF